ncbi:auxin-responsive protein SAUR71-like [Vicia villosa]|uniref:auxin-responsive protein SAUR71-like n=1 Tax=Vicia villosa TaxID=3911 RepID=UPI00273AB17B|nr:auxin-responsive protein SAUR71-like [Vicia villosa]
MDFVKKCKIVLRSNKSMKKQKDNPKKPPHGCLCVYVGAERQRFIIKIKILNHHLFKSLLEDVENEYGYGNNGPLWLPCDVNIFCEALMEIKSAMSDMGCNFHTVATTHYLEIPMYQECQR